MRNWREEEEFKVIMHSSCVDTVMRGVKYKGESGGAAGKIIIICLAGKEGGGSEEGGGRGKSFLQG